MKSKGFLAAALAFSAMAADCKEYSSEYYNSKGEGRSFAKSELNKRQKKSRAKTKQQRQSRKKNRR